MPPQTIPFGIFFDATPNEGKWKAEESNRLNAVIREFTSRRLERDWEGSSLETYLAWRLNTLPKRIANKFPGRSMLKRKYEPRRALSWDEDVKVFDGAQESAEDFRELLIKEEEMFAASLQEIGVSDIPRYLECRDRVFCKRIQELDARMMRASLRNRAQENSSVDEERIVTQTCYSHLDAIEPTMKRTTQEPIAGCNGVPLAIS